ncbi:MAG TPA: GNAT family N-acetyltransferase [Candidatus Saccharimonadales bacterium]
MIQVKNAHTTSFDAAELTLLRGWNDDIAAQLVELSKEAEIRKYTPKDVARRFSDVAAAHAWYKSKPHIVYTLQHKGKVGGLFWFSYEPRAELQSDYTIGIRMYEMLRGKGLAGALIEACHEDFRKESGYAGGIWLITDDNNDRAQHIYAKHGYEVRNKKDGRVLSVRAI